MRILSIVRVCTAYAVLAVLVSLFLVFATVTLKWGVRHYFHRFARLFGRTYMAIVGVKVESPSQEALNTRAARVVIMNHSSQLDFFMGAWVMPPWGTVIAKREILKVPLLGWAVSMLGLVLIDRSNAESARRTMGEAAARIREEQASVFIAPEGTRSRDGRLGAFKMGAFHLATEVKAPVVMVFFRGPALLQPLGTQWVRPGTVSVEILETLQWEDIADLSPHALRDRVRAVYLDAMGQSASD